MAAISGLREPRWVMPAKPRSPTHGRSPVTNAFRSMPAQKPRPAPVSTPTESASSSSSWSSAAATPSAIAALTALRCVRPVQRDQQRALAHLGQDGGVGHHFTVIFCDMPSCSVQNRE